MAIKRTQLGLVSSKRSEGGFALLVAVIFTSVMLAFGLEMASLGYKQSQLTSNAVGSQYAFYAADAALECALYADQQEALFDFPDPEPSSAPLIACDGSTATYPPLYPTGIVSYVSASGWIVSERLSVDNGKRCADVTLYKYADKKAFIYSQGYDVSCAVVANPSGGRLVSRGLRISY
jgi:hypothetical protein